MKRIVMGVVCLVALAAGVYFLMRRPAAIPQGGGKPPVVDTQPVEMTPEQASRIARELPLAVAHLENLKPDQALPILVELEKLQPGQKAIRRNLAIARVLVAMNPKSTDPPALLEQYQQAAIAELERYQMAFPQDNIPFLFRGMLSRTAGEYGLAFQQFAQACSPAGQADYSRTEPALLFALADAGLKSTAPGDKETSRRALAAAVEQQPEDLWLLLVLCGEQVASKDAGLGTTLGHLKKLTPLFSEPVRRATRLDVDKSLASMEEALTAGNWPVVMRHWGPFRNVLIPTDAAQADLKRLNRHPLDFVMSEIAGVQSPVTPASPAIPLQFAPWALPEPYSQPALVSDARWVDLNFDHIPELCVLEPSRLAIWSRGVDKAWKLVSECPVQGMRAMVVADLDDDAVDLPTAATPGARQTPVRRADLDFVLHGPDGIQLVRTDRADGAIQLTPWSAEVTSMLGKGISAIAAADFDGEGDIDLLIAGEQGLKLALNTGGPAFEIRTDTPVLVPAGVAITQLRPVDLDRDHDVDVVVVAGGEAFLLTNLRHATLRWSELPGLKNNKDVSQVCVLDADANASWDLLLSGPQGQRLVTSRTIQEGDWNVSGETSLSTQPVAAAALADLDNDGRQDLIKLSPGLSLERGVAGAFTAVPDWKWAADLSARACQAIDADGDGDLDLCLPLQSGLTLWENQGGNKNSWISFEVVAEQEKNGTPVQSGRVNNYGVCSVAEAKTSVGFQAHIIDCQSLHCGLGPNGKMDFLRMVWQNGSPMNTIEPQTNTTLWEVQTLGGSCPYLYTWDGEKFVFATDLLWAAPLGMPSPNGGLTPAREWEYLKIPGSILKERDGRYQLQLTEELYEAAYFDKVQLIAVDHPSDVEVYSNEKVGPPAIAEKKIHTVRQPRLPLSAKDQQGRDLLPAISILDENYTKHWDKKIKQGWTEKTTLELDLGAIPDKSQVTLFLTGWVYPTDPAVSISIQQNPERAGFGIQPPSLEVPDGQGGWKVASPYIGFPGGKTKTIAVDLTGQLTPGDGRLRLITSMELCWDQVFFTVDEAPAEVRETPLELLAADLHFRGCSGRVIHPQNGPERCDYSQVNPMVYSSMSGRFTRFGDVKELLTDQDDRMVILGCGDECTLTFQAPPPPPTGWTRDFLIHNVGWDKDCNPQNIYGKTVEPLPYAGMGKYPPAAPFPDDQPHRDYLQKYQTREQNDIPFRRFLFVTE